MSHSHNVLPGGCIHPGPLDNHHGHGTIGNGNDQFNNSTHAEPIHAPITGTVDAVPSPVYGWNYQHHLHNDAGFGNWNHQNHEPVISNPQNVQYHHPSQPTDGPIVFT